jgi:hypothetical protein
MILCGHERIVADLDAVDLTGAVIANNVLAGSIGIGKRAFGSGHILMIYIDRHLVIGLVDSAVLL